MHCEHCGAKLSSRVCDYCDSVSEDFIRKEKLLKPTPVGNIAPETINTAKNKNSGIEGIKKRMLNDIGQKYFGKTEIKTEQNYLLKPKSKILALILLICLGFFGVHKFYEGKIRTGIIYVILTVVGYGVGIWLADLIVLALLIIDFIVLWKKPKTYYVKG
jgi:TM2 domain-containing membrane protein YozV